MRENNTDDCLADGTSDGNFARLLQHSWTPPEPRADFQSELLAKLCVKQQQTATTTRRRTVIRLFTATLSAAAAMLMLSLNPFSLTPDQNLTNRNIHSVDISDNPTISVNIHPTLTPPGAIANVKPTVDPIRPIIAANNPLGSASLTIPVTTGGTADATTPTVTRSTGIPVYVHHGLEYRTPSALDWKAVANRGSFRLVEGMEIRSPTALNKPVGLGFSKAAGLVLSPGALLRYEKGSLILQNGTVIALVGPDEQSVNLEVAGYSVSVKPESLLLFTVKADPKYTPQGAPAPTVMVFKGGAVTRNSRGSGSLAEGLAYTMDHYLTPQVPGRHFSSGEQNMAKGINRMPWNMAGFEPGQ